MDLARRVKLVGLVVLFAVVLQSGVALAQAPNIQSTPPGRVDAGRPSKILVTGHDLGGATLMQVGGATATIEANCSCMILATTSSLPTGTFDVSVTTPGGTTTKGGGITGTGGGGDAAAALTAAEQDLFNVYQSVRALIFDQTINALAEVNTAHDRAAVDAGLRSYYHELTTLTPASQRTIADIVARGVSDILSLGGTVDQTQELTSFAQGYKSELEELGGWGPELVAMADSSWSEALGHRHSPLRLPHELSINFPAFVHFDSSNTDVRLPFNDTAVQKPTALGVGEVRTTMSGSMRFEFSATDNPDILAVVVTNTDMQGTSMTMGPLVSGEMHVGDDSSAQSTGTLDLRNGVMILHEHHGVSSPLLSAAGLSPVPVTLETRGVIAPIASLMRDLNMSDRRGGVLHGAVALLVGQGFGPTILGLPALPTIVPC